MTLDDARRFALTLPGVEEGTSYGTAAFRVAGKLFARQHDDGETLIVRAIQQQREMLLQADPEVFYVTDHYRAHPWVLVRLGNISLARLRETLEEAWRLRAPKRLVDAFDPDGDA
jgi:hypothetical protein